MRRPLNRVCKCNARVFRAWHRRSTSLILWSSVFFFFFGFQPKATRAGDEKHRKKSTWPYVPQSIQKVKAPAVTMTNCRRAGFFDKVDRLFISLALLMTRRGSRLRCHCWWHLLSTCSLRLEEIHAVQSHFLLSVTASDSLSQRVSLLDVSVRLFMPLLECFTNKVNLKMPGEKF